MGNRPCVLSLDCSDECKKCGSKRVFTRIEEGEWEKIRRKDLLPGSFFALFVVGNIRSN